MEPPRGPSEFQSISRQFAAAKKKPRQVATKAEDQEKATSQFKSLHLGTLAFFAWLFALHVTGIFFFTRGFLLTRLVLNHKSECTSAPLTIPGHQQGSYSNGCWYPKSFDKAVIIVIDALRYDFTVPHNARPNHFHNALSVFHDIALDTPQNAFLLPFIADPPTTTLQRLKGLTTGTLPTFVDVGSSFSGTTIDEDNLIDQLRKANKTLVHLGDDTWHSLFPGYFDANLTHAYDSFNVWDLHTVDNGVTEHLIPLLHPDNTTKWDVIFGHYLGVDHAGHRYGPDHSAMAAKLQEMDQVFRNAIDLLDDGTLLVVMGDHGMDVKGDHGGESDDEVEAALWMYSKKGIFGRSQPEFRTPPKTARERPVGQIDLVPTLGLLLGLPIPFNNLGAPIEEAFIGRNGLQWSSLASANAVTGAQIRNYQNEYAIARGVNESVTSGTQNLWNQANETWAQIRTARRDNADLSKKASLEFSKYQRLNLSICRDLWARFDVPSMLHGIGILFLALLTIYSFARCSPRDTLEIVPRILRRIPVWGSAGLGLGGVINQVFSLVPLLDGLLLGAVWGSIFGYIYTFKETIRHFPVSFWGTLALIFTFAQSIGFASNSFTIWEDEILLFFLNTFALVALASSLCQGTLADRVLGMYQSILFLFLTRVASLSRLCREEQMPSCRSTYYASATSSTSATWQLLIPFALAIFLPSIIKSYYQGTRSYEGSAIFWIGSAFRIGLLGSSIYWTLDAADDGDWFGIESERLQTIKVVIAQIILALAFAAGSTTYAWARPCVRVETVPVSSTGPPNGSTTVPCAKSITILGYANVHGSRYFLLLSNWVLAAILVQKPMGGGALGLMTWQILALLEIIDTNHLSQSAIGPIVLGLLGNFYFFKTGHQATLSSIQWNSAFIALKTIRYPWSPLLVTLNTFGAHVLSAVAVPLLVLWKRPPKMKNGGVLLGDVGRCLATFLSYHATINLATTMWAGWLRRHLMLYRIFNPRFLTGAAVLVVTDVVGMVVALGGLRWNVLGIADVFGWEK